MAKRKVISTGKGTEVNGEGNENVDGSTTTAGQLDVTQLNDLNTKVAGQANGKRMANIVVPTSQ